MDNMDSIEVRIPDEIREYKEKYGGFTFRQWIGIVLVFLVCVPSYYLLYKYTVQTFAMIVTTLLAAPIGLIFFVPINGMNAEKMLPYFKRLFIDFGTVLKFQTISERKIEQELMKDKKYQKKMKKLKKMEAKHHKRIQRGSATEENEQLRAYRAEVDAYYNALRKEKMDTLLTSKISDIGLALNRKEQKKLKKESRRIHEEKVHSYLTEDELGNQTGDDSNYDAYGTPYQANSLRSSLEDKKSFGMSELELEPMRNSEETDGNENNPNSGYQTLSSDMSFMDESDEGNKYKQDDSVSVIDTEHDSDAMERPVKTSVDSKLNMNASATDDEEERSSVKRTELNESTTSSHETVENQGLSKRQQILQFYRTHPGASKADCKAATGIEMRTIKRCWPKD